MVQFQPHYIGKLNWYKYDRKGYNTRGLRTEEKVHVFTANDGKTFFSKKSVEFLSESNSDQPVTNLAELMDKFNQKPYSNKIVGYEFRPVSFCPDVRKNSWGGFELCRKTYFAESDIPGVFCTCHYTAKNDHKTVDGKYEYFLKGFEFEYSYNHSNLLGIRQSNGELIETTFTPFPSMVPTPRYIWSGPPSMPKVEDVTSLKLYDCYVIFENGKTRKVHDAYNLSSEDY